MKKFSILAVLIIAVACNNQNPDADTSVQENNWVQNVMNDFSSIENIPGNQIEEFKREVAKTADKSVPFNAETAEKALLLVEKYTHAYVFVENHTVVEITALNDCKNSGSWGGCMPMVDGYIRKSGLNADSDYMNNIIGIPDGQERIMYLFR